MCSFQEVWLNYCIRLLSCVTVLSLLEISVIKMGNRSLGYFPYQNSVLWSHVIMMAFVLLYIGCLKLSAV